jgi:hypothetical protein
MNFDKYIRNDLKAEEIDISRITWLAKVFRMREGVRETCALHVQSLPSALPRAGRLAPDEGEEIDTSGIICLHCLFLN